MRHRRNGRQPAAADGTHVCKESCALMQLFSRGADTVLRLVLAGALAALLGGPLLLMWWVRMPYVTGQFVRVEQPVDFDHRHHVVDDGIGCVYCHVDVVRGPSAGVPPTELCMNCHNQIWNRSPMLAPVWQSVSEARPIVWRRVNALPDFVYFNHAVHVRQGVGCETCHGRVDTMARVYQQAPLTMGWCLDCHRHPERYLRPREEVFTMGYQPADSQLETGRALVRTYGVNSLTHCTTCHR